MAEGGTCHEDDQKEHDASAANAKSVLRLRKTAEGSDKENKQEEEEGVLDSHVRAPGNKRGFPSYIIWLVLSVALVLLISLGIYGWV